MKCKFICSFIICISLFWWLARERKINTEAENDTPPLTSRVILNILNIYTISFYSKNWQDVLNAEVGDDIEFWVASNCQTALRKRQMRDERRLRFCYMDSILWSLNGDSNGQKKFQIGFVHHSNSNHTTRGKVKFISESDHFTISIVVFPPL